jgi:transcriptional regulator with XRE-family HTH domain
MDRRTELRDFLISRRARVSPAQAGLTAFGGNRRVPGLRREELAMLAGMSVDYYTRLERGNVRGPSDAVLEGLARVLQLDETEREHLFVLARENAAPPPRRRRPTPAKDPVRPSVRHILDTTAAPAYVRNRRMDMLAANRLAQAVFAPIFAQRDAPANIARFVFLSPAAPDFYDNWDGMADTIVNVLRAEAGRSPDDRALMELIGELSTRSHEFRVRWASHNVRSHRSGAKTLHHPVVGELNLYFEAMELTADSELVFIAYAVEPGSSSSDALSLLASWSATDEQESTTQTGNDLNLPGPG